MRRRIEILTLLVVALSMTCCNRAPIDSEKMEDILFDIYRTDATVNVMHRNMSAEERVKYYDSIFEKHGVTKEEFDEALDWYAHHSKEWQLIHHNLIERTETFAARVEDYEFTPNEKPGVQTTIDTMDLWCPRGRWSWHEGDGDLDRRQVDFDLDNRKFFIGAMSIHFGMHMRCWTGDTTDSVTTTMVIAYTKGDNDTLRYVAPADSVERIYCFTKVLKERTVSTLSVHLMDTVDNLKCVDVSRVYLKYPYDNTKKSMDRVYKQVLRDMKNELRNNIDRKPPLESIHFVPQGKR